MNKDLCPQKHFFTRLAYLHTPLSFFFTLMQRAFVVFYQSPRVEECSILGQMQCSSLSLFTQLSNHSWGGAGLITHNHHTLLVQSQQMTATSIIMEQNNFKLEPEQILYNLSTILYRNNTETNNLWNEITSNTFADI